MRLSLFTVVFGLAASVVSAATMGKRGLSVTAQKCLADISAISSEVLVLQAAVSGFTTADGYGGALQIHGKVQALEKLIAVANNDCCSIRSATEDEADALLAKVSTLVPHIVSVTASLNTKKPQLDAILLADILVNADIRSLQAKTAAMDTCLYSAAPVSKRATAQVYINTINKAFAATFKVWGL